MKKHSIRSGQESDDSTNLYRKAAAWAWYQHGRRRSSRIYTLPTKSAAVSGSAAATAAGSQASRFKTEAEKPDTTPNSAGRSLALLSLLPREQTQQCFLKDRKNGKHSDSVWDCGSTLYDSVELLSLSNQLGRCLTTVHSVTAPPPEYLLHSQLKKTLSKARASESPSIPRNLPLSQRFVIPKSSLASSIVHPYAASPVTYPSQEPQVPKEKFGIRKAFQSLFKSFQKVPATKQLPEGDQTKHQTKKKCIICQKTHEIEHEHFRQNHNHHHQHHHGHKNEMLRGTCSTMRSRKLLHPGTLSGAQPILSKELGSRVTLPIAVSRR